MRERVAPFVRDKFLSFVILVQFFLTNSVAAIAPFIFITILSSSHLHRLLCFVCGGGRRGQMKIVCFTLAIPCTGHWSTHPISLSLFSSHWFFKRIDGCSALSIFCEPEKSANDTRKVAFVKARAGGGGGGGTGNENCPSSSRGQGDVRRWMSRRKGWDMTWNVTSTTVLCRPRWSLAPWGNTRRVSINSLRCYKQTFITYPVPRSLCHCKWSGTLMGFRGAPHPSPPPFTDSDSAVLRCGEVRRSVVWSSNGLFSVWPCFFLFSTLIFVWIILSFFIPLSLFFCCELIEERLLSPDIQAAFYLNSGADVTFTTAPPPLTCAS